MKPLRISDRGEWRRWLEANLNAREVWLTIRKKASKRPGIDYDQAIEEALALGWIDSKMRAIDSEEFILRFTPRRGDSLWSLRNREIAERLISEGRMSSAGLARVEEAKRNGRWDAAYTSKMPPNVPNYIESELKRLDAWSGFTSLSNSAQLQYIYWIEDAKKPETRARRIAEIVRRISA